MSTDKQEDIVLVPHESVVTSEKSEEVISAPAVTQNKPDVDDTPVRPIRTLSTIESFGVAGLSACISCCFVHPLDVIRVRMQLDSEGGGVKQFRNPLHCATSILRENGVRGIYAGLSAGLFRQILYGMPRMAIYSLGLKKFTTPGVPVDLSTKILIGCGAGVIGSVIGVPADVTMVRMAADAKAPRELRRNYSNVLTALYRMSKEEGLVSLWSGATPTVVRGCLLTGGQLGFYSEAKERLIILSSGQITGIPLQLLSGLASASAATAMSCPADVIKSRIQNAAPGQYSGIMDCAAQLLRYEGVTAFWKGSLPAVIKLAPQSLISLTLLDHITHFFTGSDAM